MHVHYVMRQNAFQQDAYRETVATIVGTHTNMCVCADRVDSKFTLDSLPLGSVLEKHFRSTLSLAQTGTHTQVEITAPMNTHFRVISIILNNTDCIGHTHSHANKLFYVLIYLKVPTNTQ